MELLTRLAYLRGYPERSIRTVPKRRPMRTRLIPCDSSSDFSSRERDASINDDGLTGDHWSVESKEDNRPRQIFR
jgi:hypothetical protein